MFVLEENVQRLCDDIKKLSGIPASLRYACVKATIAVKNLADLALDAGDEEPEDFAELADIADEALGGLTDVLFALAKERRTDDDGTGIPAVG